MVWIHKNKNEQISGYGFPEYCDEVEKVSTKDLFFLLCWMIAILILMVLMGYLNGVQG